MRLTSEKMIACFACLICMLVSCTKAPQEAKVPYYNTADFTPLWISDPDSIDTLHTVGDFNFSDQFGETVTNDKLRGKVYLTNFFFTDCGTICPTMTENIKTIYDRYKGNPQLMFLSHSVDPESDNAERLHDYAESKGILSRQWLFVTGKRAAIYTTGRKGYFVEEVPGLSKDSSEFLHTEKFVLVDKKGHIRGFYNGTVKTELDRIMSDIDWLLQES